MILDSWHLSLRLINALLFNQPPSYSHPLLFESKLSDILRLAFFKSIMSTSTHTCLSVCQYAPEQESDPAITNVPRVISDGDK